MLKVKRLCLLRNNFYFQINGNENQLITVSVKAIRKILYQSKKLAYEGSLRRQPTYNILSYNQSQVNLYLQ